MERSEQYKGWKSACFNIGRFDPQNQTILDAPEDSEKKDRCCSQEPCGCGCYVSVIDVDRLDQQ